MSTAEIATASSHLMACDQDHLQAVGFRIQSVYAISISWKDLVSDLEVPTRTRCLELLFVV